MQEKIGICSLCGGAVIRETSLDVDDECEGCHGIRKDYVIEIYHPSPMAKPNVYERLEDEPRRQSVLDWEDVYNAATY